MIRALYFHAITIIILFVVHFVDCSKGRTPPPSSAAMNSLRNWDPLEAGVAHMRGLWEHWRRNGTLSAASSCREDRRIVPESDLSDPNRAVWVVTTAALPWLTGTSVNPLLRAAHLARRKPPGKVFLMIPWIEENQQKKVFPPGLSFKTREDQRHYIFEWLSNEAGLADTASKLQIVFYDARFQEDFHSIFPVEDLCALVPDELADVCLLEEPEHLSWFKVPFATRAWTDKFRHVVGIVHTNYLAYVKSVALGHFASPLLYFINQGLCRAYCHKIIKLSAALQEYAPEKEIVCNVHGVRGKFLLVGNSAASHRFKKGAYFVGKLAWQKGLDEMLRLMCFVRKRTGQCFSLDVYGSGPHERKIQQAAARRKLPIRFHGARDHALLSKHRVFVNPSTTEVLCTTTAEALAMGKWVVAPRHSSNEFFESFSNCLLYSNEEQFAANVCWAMSNDPKPLTAAERESLTWEVATDRLVEASMMTREMQRESQQFTVRFLAWALEMAQSSKCSDFVRQLLKNKNGDR